MDFVTNPVSVFKILIFLKHVFRSNALIVFRFEVFYAGIIHLLKKEGKVLQFHFISQCSYHAHKILKIK